MVFTMQRYPIAVSFRLSETDARRLNRLLNRYGLGFGIKGDSARFRAMLKQIDDKLITPWESEEYSKGYRDDREDSQAEEMRFKQWRKQRDADRAARRRAAAQQSAQRPKIPDPDDWRDDRNWDFGENEELL